MTLQSSGAISLGQIGAEAGDSGPNINLNDSVIRTLLGKPTNNSTVSLSDGYGKSSYVDKYGAYATYHGYLGYNTGTVDDVRDETGLDPATQYNSYTTAKTYGGDCDIVWELHGVSGRTIKLVVACDFASNIGEQAAYNCYMDCGEGVHVNRPAEQMVCGLMYIETAPSLNGTYTRQATYEQFNNLGKTYISFAAPSNDVWVKVGTVIQEAEAEVDPCCPGSTYTVYGTAIVSVYVIKA